MSDLLLIVVFIINVFNESLLIMWFCCGKFLVIGGWLGKNFDINVLLVLIICFVNFLCCVG